MAQRKKKRASGTFGIGTEVILAALVVLFIVSGGLSVVNGFIDGLGFHGLPSRAATDGIWFWLGVAAIVIGGGIGLGRRLGVGSRTHWAAQVLGIHSVNDIYAFSPAQFEQFVAFLFTRRGYTAHVVGQTGDQGIDIELRQAGHPGAPRVVVQCKRYAGSVGQPLVREFYGSFAAQATEGYLVTTGTFTQPARDWAASRPLHLIDGPTLLRWTEEVAHQMHQRGDIPAAQISWPR